MNPKKSKDLIQEVCEKLEIPYDDLYDISSTFWDEIGDIMRNLKYHRIYVEKFGEFSVKRWLVKKKHNLLKKRMSTNPCSSFLQRIQQEEFSETLKKYEEIEEMFQEEFVKKDNIKTKRENYEKKRSDPDMEI